MVIGLLLHRSMAAPIAYEIVPTPKSFVGVELGATDYRDAEGLFGYGQHSTGVHPHSRREVSVRSGTIVFDGAKPASKKGKSRGYYIDGVSLDVAGVVGASHAERKWADSWLLGCSTRTDVSQLRASLQKAGRSLKLLGPVTGFLKGKHLVVWFEGGHPYRFEYFLAG